MKYETRDVSAWTGKAKWPLFLAANLALLLVVGVSTVRETYRGWTVDAEIRALEQKAEQLEGRRTQLASMASRLQSDPYAERQARSKLGLQKPGEHVVILEGFNATRTTMQLATADFASEQIDLRSNPRRWWDYFTQ